MPETTAPAPIILRPWKESEAARVAELFRSLALTRNLTSNLPNPYTQEHGLDFIRRSLHCDIARGMELAIEWQGEAIGTIGARFADNTATVGYWLGEDWWGQGIMSRALPLFIDMLPPPITLLVAHTFEFNAASQALLRRCGFTQLPGHGWERSYDQQFYATRSFERPR